MFAIVGYLFRVSYEMLGEKELRDCDGDTL